MKVNKIPKFYMIFARILTKYIVICHENIFPDFFFGGGATALSACPVSYAYAGYCYQESPALVGRR